MNHDELLRFLILDDGPAAPSYSAGITPPAGTIWTIIPATFTATTNVPSPVYTWSVGPGATIVSGQGTASAVIRFDSAGSRSVSLAVTGGGSAAANWAGTVTAFTPAAISGLVLWLDASNAGTITVDGADNVGQWSDGSGAGRHLTQADTLRKPKYIANVFGSLPAVRTDGGDDIMETATTAASEFYGSGTQGFTAIYAGRRQAETGRTFSFWHAAADQRFWFDRDIPASSTSDGHLRTPVSADYITAAPYNGITSGINTYRWTSGNAWSLRRCIAGVATSWNGGVVSGSMTTAGKFAIGSDGVRGNVPGPFNFAELAWYSRELTNTETGYLETYLGGKWGI